MSKDYIKKQILDRARVVVEYDGFEHSGSTEDLFDSYDETDCLSNLQDVKRQIESIGLSSSDGSELVKTSRAQIAEIEKAADVYSELLAKNASIGKVDVTKQKPEIYEKLATRFERDNKRLLKVLSPSHWIM